MGTLGVGRETKGQLAHNNSGIVLRLASTVAVVSQTRSANLFLHCVKLPRRRNAGLFLFRCVRPPRRKKEIAVAKGTVKWFNATKGYGFIQPTSGGKDVFVHISAVERAGLATLNEGQVIEYEEASNRGKTSAENLRVQR
jgi:cold shock protein